MVAITLLLIHLFNLAGYHLLFECFIARADQRLLHQLDHDQYNENELIEVRVPLHLPYLSNWNEYERVAGEMEVEGHYYTYVKRKVQNDTLFLLCLPNKYKTQLSHARNEYGRQANGLPGEESTQSWIKKINITGEYRPPPQGYTIAGLPRPAHCYTSFAIACPVSPFRAGTYHPPRCQASLLSPRC